MTSICKIYSYNDIWRWYSAAMCAYQCGPNCCKHNLCVQVAVCALCKHILLCVPTIVTAHQGSIKQICSEIVFLSCKFYFFLQQVKLDLCESFKYI